MTDAIASPEAFKFEVKNLGNIQKGEFTPKPLTVFCGPNNSGKTWTMYALYYFYQLIGAQKNEDGNNQVPLAKFNARLSHGLPTVFNDTSGSIGNAHFTLDTPKENFAALLAQPRSHTFLMPAERNGLHLFFRELRTRRTALLHHASQKNIDIHQLLQDVIRSRYATPIANYINWLNNIDELRKQKAEFHGFTQYLQKKLVGGTYRVSAQTGDIEFKPYQKNRQGLSTEYMGLHLTSSTVKSLFGLWFYLRHEAKKGDIIMIDEPELNIHPENQRKIARLLAQLVNAGLKVVISTHSDYIIREINTLIMLSQQNTGKLRARYGYGDDEVLTTTQVGAYLFDHFTIQPFAISPADGIYASTFDDVINDLNNTNDDIYYRIQGMTSDD